MRVGGDGELEWSSAPPDEVFNCAYLLEHPGRYFILLLITQTVVYSYYNIG